MRKTAPSPLLTALVPSNFTTSGATEILSVRQAGSFSLFTIALYGLFLWLQTGRHQGFLLLL